MDVPTVLPLVGNHICPRHYVKGQREDEINPCKHIDCADPSKELHRQAMSSLGV
jgi:hypothetical protein